MVDNSALETLLSHKWPGNEGIRKYSAKSLGSLSEKQICSSDIVIDNNPINNSGDILSIQKHRTNSNLRFKMSQIGSITAKALSSHKQIIES